jgi:hypothetical protein
LVRLFDISSRSINVEALTLDVFGDEPLLIPPLYPFPLLKVSVQGSLGDPPSEAGGTSRCFTGEAEGER